MDFSKELSVGNRFLDSEHRLLQKMISEIIGLISAGNVAALSEAFSLLEIYLSSYFIDEEQIAHAVGIDFTRHRHAHQKIQSELKLIKDAVIDGECTCPGIEENNYIKTLRCCLFKHIKEDSRSLKTLLDTQLYDFKPDCVTSM